MRKFLLIFFLLTAICRFSTGQDLYDKISKKMCKCLEKGGSIDTIVGYKCYDDIIFEYAERLVEYHKLNSIEELDIEEFSNMTWGRMAKNCKYLIKVLLKDSILKDNPQFVPDASPVCDSIHTGEFYYLERSAETGMNDTTYATFMDTEYFERMQRSNTYSQLSIKWTSDCHFRLTFIESDDPLKKSFSKPGDSYEYEVRKVTKDSFIAEYLWDGPKVFIEFIRVK